MLTNSKIHSKYNYYTNQKQKSKLLHNEDHILKHNQTCKLLLVASLNKLELFTALDLLLVSSPSSSASCKRKRCRPTANLRKASPSDSSLSREKRSWHFSVVSASRT